MKTLGRKYELRKLEIGNVVEWFGRPEVTGVISKDPFSAFYTITWSNGRVFENHYEGDTMFKLVAFAEGGPW